MGRNKSIVEGTPESEAKAREFLEWCGEYMDVVRDRMYLCGLVPIDEDALSDAMLRAYGAIVRTGAEVKNKSAYLIRSYRAELIDRYRTAPPPSAEEHELQNLCTDGEAGDYEQRAEALRAEITAYIRGKYSEFDISLFEIYVGLSPDISYKRMSALLGIPASRIWPVVGKIKKDVAERYGGHYRALLSALNG